MKRTRKNRQGQKSVKFGRENREKIFHAIVKEPLTFKQLLEQKIVSRHALALHLDAMMKNLWIEQTLLKDAKGKNRIHYQSGYLADKEIVREIEETSMRFIMLSTMCPSLLNKAQPSLLDKMKELIETRKERAEALDVALKRISEKKYYQVGEVK